MLPQELGCGSGVTCWRRLRDWTRAGVWHQLHRVLLDRLGEMGALDWSRACLDSASIPAKKGGDAIGPNPTDRGKPGTKRHLLVDRRGIPLAAGLTGANRHDSSVLAALLDAVTPISDTLNSRRHHPAKLHADKGYDYPACRQALRERGIADRIARRGVEDKQRLGRHRWVVERTLAWLARYRRLAVRYERHESRHQAFLDLGCALICLNALRRCGDGPDVSA